MKRLILTCIALIGISLSVNAQAKIIVRRPAVRAIIVPASRVVVRPVATIRPVVVAGPIIVTRRVAVVRPALLPRRRVVVY